MKKISISTSTRAQMVDITSEVQSAIDDISVPEGVATVHVPHTTAGVTVNENADPDVVDDILATLDRMVPPSGNYRHAEGNADAHVKSSLMGHSASLPVRNGKLVLGTWQGIYFCEFDGPRSRHIFVTVSS
jgi:secondary thiamine-phosphate synthase enzyme